MNDHSETAAVFVPRFRVKHHFEFDIGDRVIIRGSSMEADVTALIKDQDGEQYRIAWWYSGARHDAWVFSREIVLKGK